MPGDLIGELGGELLATALVTNDDNPKKKWGCTGLALAFIVAGAGLVVYCSSGDRADANKVDPNKTTPTEEPCPPKNMIAPAP